MVGRGGQPVSHGARSAMLDCQLGGTDLVAAVADSRQPITSGAESARNVWHAPSRTPAAICQFRVSHDFCRVSHEIAHFPPRTVAQAKILGAANCPSGRPLSVIAPLSRRNSQINDVIFPIPQTCLTLETTSTIEHFIYCCSLWWGTTKVVSH